MFSWPNWNAETLGIVGQDDYFLALNHGPLCIWVSQLGEYQLWPTRETWECCLQSYMPVWKWRLWPWWSGSVCEGIYHTSLMLDSGSWNPSKSTRSIRAHKVFFWPLRMLWNSCILKRFCTCTINKSKIKVRSLLCFVFKLKLHILPQIKPASSHPSEWKLSGICHINSPGISWLLCLWRHNLTLW